MHAVVALILPDLVAFDLAVPAHVFGQADKAYSFSVCSVQPGPVPTTTGYTVHAQAGLEALATADTIVVPGYAPPTSPPEAAVTALSAAASRGVRVVSICTGAFALAAAGLIHGRRATTHWQDAAELAARHPYVQVEPDVLYVDEGQVLTSAGIAAGIDLCLHVVRSDLGEETATRIARQMVVAPHRQGGQAQYIQRPLPAPGTDLAGTCTWALQRLTQPLTVADLARHAGWAPRTFARRFVAETGVTPLKWLTAQRILHARRLLESTDLTIDDVAQRCGLGSAANLRLHLARDASISPSAYRRAYRGAATARVHVSTDDGPEDR